MLFFSSLLICPFWFRRELKSLPNKTCQCEEINLSYLYGLYHTLCWYTFFSPTILNFSSLFVLLLIDGFPHRVILLSVQMCRIYFWVFQAYGHVLLIVFIQVYNMVVNRITFFIIVLIHPSMQFSVIKKYIWIQ